MGGRGDDTPGERIAIGITGTQHNGRCRGAEGL